MDKYDKGIYKYVKPINLKKPAYSWWVKSFILFLFSNNVLLKVSLNSHIKNASVHVLWWSPPPHPIYTPLNPRFCNFKINKIVTEIDVTSNMPTSLLPNTKLDSFGAQFRVYEMKDIDRGIYRYKPRLPYIKQDYSWWASEK